MTTPTTAEVGQPDRDPPVRGDGRRLDWRVSRRDGCGRTLDRRLVTLLTVAEVADLLRTSKRGIYAMIARRQLAGVVRVGRRVLVNQEVLLLSLTCKKSAPSSWRR